MSIDEARQQKAMALLEFQDAKEASEALRKQARDAAELWKHAFEYAFGIQRVSSHWAGTAKIERAFLDSDRPKFQALLNLQDVFDLDDKIIAADERLRVATEVKKTFGIKD